jgi:hypothetical protein
MCLLYYKRRQLPLHASPPIKGDVRREARLPLPIKGDTCRELRLPLPIKRDVHRELCLASGDQT